MIETAAPGLHDAILLGAGIAAVYLVVALLQLLQLGRHAPSVSVREPAIEPRYRSETAPLAADTLETEQAFAAQLRRSTLEADIKRLSHEVQSLRENLSEIREEMETLRLQRNAHNGAPVYNEAMSLAKRGLNAGGIASRCGISRGEAELVAALARDPKDLNAVADKWSLHANGATHESHSRYRAAA